MSMVEAIVVGAGPYGLSMAAHLRAANIGFQIIGQPMESWRKHMPAGMALKSEPFASNLSDPTARYTLENFRIAGGRTYRRKGGPLAIADFIDYADWFRRQAVPDIRDVKVTRLRRIAGGFELMLDDGDVALAKRVILATGHLAFRNIPTTLSQFPKELVSHSADHCDLSQLAGRDVTIVGCGQSGLETAALLHEQGAHVRVLARAPAIDWDADLLAPGTLFDRLRNPDAGLGPGWRNLAHSELPRLFYFLPARTRRRIVATANGPSGAWWLKQRVIGKVPLLASTEITHAVARNGRLQLSVRTATGMKQFSTDHLIAGTGYKVDLGRLTMIDEALRSDIKTFDGAPVLDSVLESSVPGLYFVGIASALSFGPVMRFVYGAKHAAAVLTAHLQSSARSRSAPIRMPLGSPAASH
jgi:FAD-dependent urate hydroxylase